MGARTVFPVPTATSLKRGLNDGVLMRSRPMRFDCYGIAAIALTRNSQRSTLDPTPPPTQLFG